MCDSGLDSPLDVNNDSGGAQRDTHSSQSIPQPGQSPLGDSRHLVLCLTFPFLEAVASRMPASASEIRDVLISGLGPAGESAKKGGKLKDILVSDELRVMIWPDKFRVC